MIVEDEYDYDADEVYEPDPMNTALTRIYEKPMGPNGEPVQHDPLVRDGILKVLSIFISRTVQQGAATTCFVALHPQLKEVGGEYFVDCNIAKPSSQAKDADLATRLWDFSLSLTNAK
ncbi:short-chain dehydrogenase TIC 32, chloroplastic-like [Prunus persica]|uniref:short-chain dehydrogenase TIC 32, chloroplastic-like n=1 Tax=Prunus persica TaxID=3760 RepID=UPI0009AB96D8|nr:short-chain dehydrogenase TIC 32, chloroplastic-like [Prunus persica]